MQNENLMQYLTALGKAFEPHVSAWAVEESDEGPMLVLTASAPFDEASELGYLISPSVVAENIVLFDLEIAVFTDVPEELFASLHPVIAALNNALIVGSFRLYEETAEVICQSGVILSSDMDLDAATDNVFKTLVLMENGAVNGGAELLKLIKGECTADELIADLYDMGGNEDE